MPNVNPMLWIKPFILFLKMMINKRNMVHAVSWMMMVILMVMVLVVDEEERRKVWVWGRIYFHQHLEKKQQRESMNSHNHINAVKRKKRMHSNIIPYVKEIWIKCWNVPCILMQLIKSVGWRIISNQQLIMVQ